MYTQKIQSIHHHSRTVNCRTRASRPCKRSAASHSAAGSESRKHLRISSLVGFCVDCFLHMDLNSGCSNFDLVEEWNGCLLVPFRDGAL